MKVFQPAENAAPLDHGLNVQRFYTLAGQNCQKDDCKPIQATDIGKQKNIVVHLVLTLPQEMYNLVVDDAIPAGSEILDPSLDTSQQGQSEDQQRYDPTDPYAQGWGWWLFDQAQIYDSRIRWIANDLTHGTYELTYHLTLTQAGEFRVLPAHAYEQYFPDVEGATAGQVFTITSSSTP